MTRRGGSVPSGSVASSRVLPPNPCLGDCAALRHYRSIINGGCWTVGVVSVATGALVLGGGEKRMHAPIYNAIHELWDRTGVPVTVTLGVWMVVAGLLALAPRIRPSQLGLGLCALWMFYLAVSFAVSAWTEPTVGFPALTLSFLGSVFCVALANVRLSDEIGWPR